MTGKIEPKGEWFYTADGDGESSETADEIADESAGIVEVIGAREVWRGFGFWYWNDDGEADRAWYATRAEAEAAWAEVQRKQRGADAPA